MADRPFKLKQTIFKASYPAINVVPVHLNALTDTLITTLLKSRESNFVGVAGAYGSQCVLAAVAFATSSEILLVRLGSPVGHTRSKAKKDCTRRSIDLLQNRLLCEPNIKKLSFNMDRLATSLFFDFGARVNGAIDIQSATAERNSRSSMEAIWAAIGDKSKSNERNVVDVFTDEKYDNDQTKLALRAWTSCQAVRVNPKYSAFERFATIDSNSLAEKRLHILAKFRRTMDRLDALKPTKLKNDVEKITVSKDGNVQLTCTRYKTRVRRETTVVIEYEHGGKRSASTGSAKVKGRSATVGVPFRGKDVRAVYTIGKERPTNAEEHRTEIILGCLQGATCLFNHSFVQRIWEPRLVGGQFKRSSAAAAATLKYSGQPLNPSQRQAVQIVLSDSEQHAITVIQGPPGTGKTTVIAACVTSITATRDSTRGIWLVAHSNVAVKNIAEKLAGCDFLDFRLIVSQEFHFDWHEHLYHKISSNIIPSDQLPKDIVDTERRLGGARVILCTLSMLSNESLQKAGFNRLVPVHTVIVDEASQIEVGDYLPLLHNHDKSLKKLVFIGDDKQLAPYGQDDLKDLQSIFEIPHLRKRAIFLDTQFRMPTPIGEFLSRQVYQGRLRSEHSDRALSSCRFVDVSEGRETKTGNSWQNVSEAREAIRIAAICQARGQAFRLITPYDAQRGLLEKLLKASGLPWQDKCFNVDSFQGNEEDNVIISCVRSQKIGFLSNLRRTNVMLSRCKRGMFVITSKQFLHGIASSSLMGKMAAEWGDEGWLSRRQILQGVL